MEQPFVLHHGDCLAVLRTLADNSVDSIVTDPPYGLSDHKPSEVLACLSAWIAGKSYQPKGKGFMGRSWDAWVPGPDVWRECLRVLKPGGHVLAFAGTRSMDLMSMALRLAGFELRDSIGHAHDGGGAPLMAWCYGSGFPKSLDVSKAIDKAGGASPREQSQILKARREATGMTREAVAAELRAGGNTEAAAQWEGWGTALKPAWEPIVLARKPLIGTVAENVLAHGTGALNIDGCRVPAEKATTGWGGGGSALYEGGLSREGGEARLQDAGRWPANLILSIPEDEYYLRDDVTPDQLRQLAEWMDANP